MKMIKTDKLVFEYAKRDEEGNVIGKSRAIDEVSLDIEPGQFIAILGHNGSWEVYTCKAYECSAGSV